jgi:hypothetical protein
MRWKASVRGSMGVWIEEGVAAEIVWRFGSRYKISDSSLARKLNF